MFTGIIEALGQVRNITDEGTNRRFRITSPLSRELRIDQSVSHNGACLTIVNVHGNDHEVVAVHETLSKSSLARLAIDDVINLERCMVANGRFDGHIVQGHVDQTAIVTGISDQNGSWLFDFEYDPTTGNITVEKGSICVNGVSLTCFNSRRGGFSVAIIPYTFEHTDFNRLRVGDIVNLEFDIIGKYVARLLKTS
jgi:riboflavin synthase